MHEQQMMEPVALLRAIDPAIVQPADFALSRSVCTIGRDAGCDVVVSRKEASRTHARIERQGSRYVLSDAGSVNGTYVNGRKIDEPYVLQSEDHIGLGSGPSVLKFVDPHATFIPGRLRYDDRLITFFYKGQALELTPNQSRLLLLLYRNQGRLCTRDECAQAIWHQTYDQTTHAAALDQLVTTLRTRLRQIDPQAEELIKTRRGMGYLLEQ